MNFCYTAKFSCCAQLLTFGILVWHNGAFNHLSPQNHSISSRFMISFRFWVQHFQSVECSCWRMCSKILFQGNKHSENMFHLSWEWEQMLYNNNQTINSNYNQTKWRRYLNICVQSPRLWLILKHLTLSSMGFTGVLHAFLYRVCDKIAQ